MGEKKLIRDSQISGYFNPHSEAQLEGTASDIAMMKMWAYVYKQISKTLWKKKNTQP
jgi:hypothetical protein